MFMVDKKSMKYARHGHSCIAIADRYIMCSGSRKEVSQACQKVELYDSHIDEWIELSQIIDGRHYHSSCNFDNKFVFIFGGIQNSNKKYSSSIERLQFSLNNYNNPWEKIDVSRFMTRGPERGIPSRQGAGMCQFSKDEILIVGGFNGKYLPDYYVI